jgi:hypothetical protein
MCIFFLFFNSHKLLLLMVIDITFEVSYEVFVMVKFDACLIVTGSEIVPLSYLIRL